MNDNQTKLMRNVVGPAIFAFGAIAVVMVAMTLIKGMPSEEARGVDALARGLVGFMGAIPLALMGLGAAFLGGRLFVTGLDLRLNRNLLGLVLVPLALAIFLSTIMLDGGGAFGEAIGGRVRVKMSGGLSSAIAFAFGVVVLVLPIWFVFVREYALRIMTEVNPPTAKQEDEIHAAGGLSREEADALLPEEEPVSLIETNQKNEELAELLTTQKDQRPEWLEKSSHPQAASPYEEDVRPMGEIPQGATPLATDDSSAHESSTQSSSVQRWAPENLRLADDALGADLVDEGPTEVRPELLQDREPEPAVEPEAEPVTPEPVAAAAPVAAAQPLVKAQREALPPAPSWEQSDLFEEDEEELEPAAEYEEEEEELEESAEYEEESEDELEPAAEYEEEEEELEESAEYEEEDEEELEPAAEYEEEEEELEESAEYEEEDEEEELEPAAEYEEEEEELEESAEYEDEEEEEELEPAAEYEEEDELEPAAEYEEEEELEEVAELEEEPEVSTEDDKLAEAELAEAEPEVVLTPQAPPVAETIEPAAPVEPSEGTVGDQVIYDAGVLFLERERVAVSMLQREFNLDFDESCETMDKLQSMGLIGPYVGGHRRDILMTKDQWMERVTMP